MQAKSVIYAAVGAPVVAARKVGDQVSTLRGKVSKETSSYTEAAEKAFQEWAAEGEKVVARISEGKVVEEISSKVDLDQAKQQVSKLRDQLEDMLATWRSSFRPEKAEEKISVAEPAAETAANEPATKAPAKKTAAKAPAKKAAAKKPAAKTSAAKTTKSSAAKKSPENAPTLEAEAS